MEFIIALLMALAVQEPRIAVAATAPKPDATVFSPFGRAPWLMIYDPADRKWQPVDNSSAASNGDPGGPAIEATNTLIEHSVKIVIGGDVPGPALQALSGAGIRVFMGASGTVVKALADYQAGKLTEIK